jgi:hypothetical protein
MILADQGDRLYQRGGWLYDQRVPLNRILYAKTQIRPGIARYHCYFMAPETRLKAFVILPNGISETRVPEVLPKTAPQKLSEECNNIIGLNVA